MKIFPAPKPTGPAFTLIELMAATTVLSLVLLLMVGMQDQMSRAWSNANRRTDVTREARTALRLMMGDLSRMTLRSATFPADNATPTTNAGIPILLGGLTGANPDPLKIPSWLNHSNSQYFFGVVPRRPSATNTNTSDLAIVGYYIASTNNTNASGMGSPAYNLYRYYVPETTNVTNQLGRWMAGTADLSTQITTNTSEVVARNMVGLRISFFGLTTAYPDPKDPSKTYFPVTNGLNYSIEEGKKSSACTGNRIRIQLVGYPEDTAIRLGTLSAWTNSNNLARFSRAFELGLDVRRSD